MMTIFNVPPGLLYIFGGLISLALPTRFVRLIALGVPVIAFFQLLGLGEGSALNVQFLFYSLNVLRVDALSLIFGYVFVISSFFGCLYGCFIAKKYEFSSALIYIGAALSVIFSGDLITLYIFWEVMAVSSTCLILLRGTRASRRSAMRYLMVHLVGGLVLLAGIVIHINDVGSIAFHALSTQTLGTVLMLLGVLVNAAAIPVSSWLPDAYPESTIMGGVILSAYTSKTAVYVLLRGFVGWDSLIFIGIAMALYGVIYAILENNIRRIFSYSIVNQVGFMVCAAGVGTPLAIAGACAHAFCHIIYKAVLFMSAGSIMHCTGEERLTKVGGLGAWMPITMICMLIGALSMSAMPLTSGFVSKTIILKAIEKEHLFLPWLLLEIASVGSFLYAVYKVPSTVFFGQMVSNVRQKVTGTMAVAMVAMSVLCVLIGCFPSVLYLHLPYQDVLVKKIPSSFLDIYLHHMDHVVTQLQVFVFAGIAYGLFRRMTQPTNQITVDIDIVYRRVLRYFSGIAISFVDFMYATINAYAMAGIRWVSYLVTNGLPLFVATVRVPFLPLGGSSLSKDQRLAAYHRAFKLHAFPFTVIGILTGVIFIGFVVISA